MENNLLAACSPPRPNVILSSAHALARANAETEGYVIMARLGSAEGGMRAGLTPPRLCYAYCFVSTLMPSKPVSRAATAVLFRWAIIPLATTESRTCDNQ